MNEPKAKEIAVCRRVVNELEIVNLGREERGREWKK
jgi:hypothetical protein